MASLSKESPPYLSNNDVAQGYSLDAIAFFILTPSSKKPWDDKCRPLSGP